MSLLSAYLCPTRVGVARVELSGQGPGLLVLGHGAGGGTDAVDLQAAAAAAHDLGFRVALVEQPWRVRGRRVAEAPSRLDTAWIEVLAELSGTPLVVGGRSAGARVACRTATAVGADAVLCLAFPLQPPVGGPSRSAELFGVVVPLLVVQGERDAFGVPDGAVVVAGADHAFAVRQGSAPAGPVVRAAATAWLGNLPSSREEA